jgi:hypothetical protein
VTQDFGGTAFIVVGSLLAGRSLKHALIANVFWIVLGPSCSYSAYH